MGLDLSALEPHPRTVDLPPPLEGFQVSLRHVHQVERDRWRRRLVSAGIFSKDGDINGGRWADFVREWVNLNACGWVVPERFRTDDAKEKNPEFNADELARVLLAASDEPLGALLKAASEGADFFAGSASA